MNWRGLDEWQQWVLGSGCGLVAAFLIWLGRRIFFRNRIEAPSTRQTVQQTASPILTQTFQPIINIQPLPASRIQATFQAAREQNEISGQEAEECRLAQLEKELHRLIEEAKLISTSDERLCVSRLITAARDICGFFKSHPDLRRRNLSLLKFLCSDDFAEIVENEAREVFNPNPYVRRTEDSPEHPCDAMVNPILDGLLNLKVRPSRTMKDYEDSLPK